MNKFSLFITIYPLYLVHFFLAYIAEKCETYTIYMIFIDIRYTILCLYNVCYRSTIVDCRFIQCKIMCGECEAVIKSFIVPIIQ